MRTADSTDCGSEFNSCQHCLIRQECDPLSFSHAQSRPYRYACLDTVFAQSALQAWLWCQDAFFSKRYIQGSGPPVWKKKNLIKYRRGIDISEHVLSEEFLQRERRSFAGKLFLCMNWAKFFKSEFIMTGEHCTHSATFFWRNLHQQYKFLGMERINC